MFLSFIYLFIYIYLYTPVYYFENIIEDLKCISYTEIALIIVFHITSVHYVDQFKDL